MAAQDLQYQQWRINPTQQPVLDQNSNPEKEGHSGFVPIALIAVRKYWPLFLVVIAASGGIAFAIAQQFATTTAKVETTLMNSGLPMLPGPQVYNPLSSITCAELLQSAEVLEQLKVQQDLDISTVALQRHLTVLPRQSSELIDATLAWPDATEGISVITKLSNVFIDAVAEKRREILRDHMKHIELMLLEARSDVDGARRDLIAMEKEQAKKISEGGLASDQYRDSLSKVTSTQLEIDSLQVKAFGMEQQIQAIDETMAAQKTAVSEVLIKAQGDVRHEASLFLTNLRTPYVAGSESYSRLTELITSIEQPSSESAASMDSLAALRSWYVDFMRGISHAGNPLSEKEVTALDAVCMQLISNASAAFQAKQDEINVLSKQRAQIALDLIPIEHQAKLLLERRNGYREQANLVGAQVASMSAERIQDYEGRLEKTIARQESLELQLENMKQLEKSKVREWSVSRPASVATTELDSDFKKLFAASLVGCLLLLSSPMLIIEWNRHRVSPHEQFGRQLGLPVVASRELQDFLPHRRYVRSAFGTKPLTAEHDEAIRMLALRIQQSSFQKGSVILFSSLDSDSSAAPLVAAVAKCLAMREEKVLVIDAVSPDQALLPMGSMMAATAVSNSDEVEEQRFLPAEQQIGLSEYLAQPTIDSSQLISPSGISSVDVIESGQTPFPREALATSVLTRLLRDCCKDYSIVLVNGPSANWCADLQMLAARADGVVLAATPRIKHDHRARAVVKDLVALRAPVIALVG